MQILDIQSESGTLAYFTYSNRVSKYAMTSDSLSILYDYLHFYNPDSS